MAKQIHRESIYPAVAAQRARVTPGISDMAAYLEHQVADKSHRDVLGPLLPGGGASGVVIVGGETIAEWGDADRPEMLFSATKSLLSTVAGIASDRGLLDVRAPVVETTQLEQLDTPSGRRITWQHLLQQTSQWDGVLWDKPASVDAQSRKPGSAPPDALPGAGWAYNDVRVNLLALALTELFGESLESVLRENVMHPLGASDSWSWHGYSNAFIQRAAERIAVVAGGAHWGGGLWMSARDLARVGQLYLRNDGAQLSRGWIENTFAPCDVNADYGYLWWRNDTLQVFPSAPATGRCARGNGGRHLLWIDPARDLVLVSHWGEQVGQLLQEVSEATPPR